MAWTTPKTDWATGDVPSDTDINRIESNTDYLKNTFDVSFAIFPEHNIPEEASAYNYQLIRVNIPAGKKLFLVNARYFLDNATYFRLRVKIFGGSTWTSAADNGDDDYTDLSVELYDNVSAVTATANLTVQIINLDSIIHECTPGIGWTIKLYIED